MKHALLFLKYTWS